MAPIPSAVIKAVSDARTLNEREVATRLLEMLGPTLTTAIGDAKDTRAAIARTRFVLLSWRP
jgi:hypothetical protein